MNFEFRTVLHVQYQTHYMYDCTCEITHVGLNLPTSRQAGLTKVELAGAVLGLIIDVNLRPAGLQLGQ